MSHSQLLSSNHTVQLPSSMAISWSANLCSVQFFTNLSVHTSHMSLSQECSRRCTSCRANSVWELQWMTFTCWISRYAVSLGKSCIKQASVLTWQHWRLQSKICWPHCRHLLHGQWPLMYWEVRVIVLNTWRCRSSRFPQAVLLLQLLLKISQIFSSLQKN